MPQDDDTYLTLAQRSEGLYKVKGSKHFSYAFPVTSEEDIKNCLEVIKLAHHTARHHCYAWRLGHDASRYRTNDDGEPSNTAGPPILGVLKSKLGVGGLIDAYRTAAAYAIEEGSIVEKTRDKTYVIRYPYARMGDVMNLLKRAGISPEKTDFQITCTLEATVRLRDSAGFAKSIEDLDEVQIKEA
ncbi:MAG: IMPACT family protein [Flavobacteriales bacterium]